MAAFAEDISPNADFDDRTNQNSDDFDHIVATAFKSFPTSCCDSADSYDREDHKQGEAKRKDQLKKSRKHPEKLIKIDHDQRP